MMNEKTRAFLIHLSSFIVEDALPVE